MKRLFVHAIGIGLLFAGICSLAEAAEMKLLFLTANVGTMTITAADQSRHYKISEYDLPVLKANFTALNPDIVFFQEIDSRGLQQEKRLFPKKYSVRCDGELCTAVNSEKLEFIGKCDERRGYFICTAHSSKYIPANETCEEEKGGYVCVSKRRLENKDVIKLVNLHTSSPTDDRDFTMRKEEICGAFEEMEKLHKKGFMVLNAGDFNYDVKYESKAYNKNNDKNDSLFNLSVCWGNLLSAPEPGGLRRISPDEPTWMTKKVNILRISKQLTNTLDHVITNMKAKKCKVLASDKVRLDVDKKGRRDTFMDHRGITCELTINN